MTAKTLIDYFLPMEPRGPLVSEGVWGDPNVLPRDIHNGLEDARLENWCYWDGKFDGASFDRDMQEIVAAEKATG